ncbi:MAG TPA: (Na+)-NQR maturation NqrM [Fluviicoccus sp.]|nr:(Na+)-NQR maturation NqrM [Fluviicoccus sp.]
MMLFLMAFAVIMLMIALMAIGVWLGKRPPLKGTCGGLNRFTGDKECPVCGGDAAKCETAEAVKEGSQPVEPTVNHWRP